jgi:hypothetical protein
LYTGLAAAASHVFLVYHHGKGPRGRSENPRFEKASMLPMHGEWKVWESWDAETLPLQPAASLWSQSRAASRRSIGMTSKVSKQTSKSKRVSFSVRFARVRGIGENLLA